MSESEFKQLIANSAGRLYRDMPWRRDTRPYYVLVSELMLQQTQVERVIPKFEAFVREFPSEAALAGAPLADVLRLWNGLGYNRRAKFLHQAARKIISEFGGEFPNSYEQLIRLPGVGPNTAGAILAYAFNQPVLFIETNIRSVYLHHFFADDRNVSDKQILQKLERTVPWSEEAVDLINEPRAFYWALMDYGAWLKKNAPSNLAKSRHYKRQSPLKGSIREVRGQIIKRLAHQEFSKDDLQRLFGQDKRFTPALDGLVRDGLVEQTKGIFHLTK